MIAIIDYGVGNSGSIVNMLKKVGLKSNITSDPDEIAAAEKIILPGVGSFDGGAKNLKARGLTGILNEQVLEKKKPFLGICLGMQLLAKSSEEGSETGLGWLDATVVKFDFNGDNRNLKIPHMGWNYVKGSRTHRMLNNLSDNPRFYFVHSYYLNCNQPDDILLTCNYGFDFTCGVQHENIVGVQFHPEKSHKFGMQLLKNFSEL
jgi:imidazole glycerol-phosphate synthase subunit HisH